MAASRSLEPRDKPGKYKCGELLRYSVVLLVYFLCHAALLLNEDHLQPLLSFVKCAAKKWRKIGACLNFENGVLNEIEASISNKEAVACFSELLTLWLKHALPKLSPPTLGALLEALRNFEVGEYPIAWSIEHRFKSKSYKPFVSL